MGMPVITVTGPCTYQGLGRYECEGLTASRPLHNTTGEVRVGVLEKGEPGTPLSDLDRQYLREQKGLSPAQIQQLESGKPSTSGIVSILVPGVRNLNQGLTPARQETLDQLAAKLTDPTSKAATPRRSASRLMGYGTTTPAVLYCQPGAVEPDIWCQRAEMSRRAWKSEYGQPQGIAASLRFAPQVMERALSQHQARLLAGEKLLAKVVKEPEQYAVKVREDGDRWLNTLRAREHFSDPSELLPSNYTIQTADGTKPLLTMQRFEGTWQFVFPDKTTAVVEGASEASIVGLIHDLEKLRQSGRLKRPTS